MSNQELVLTERAIQALSNKGTSLADIHRVVDGFLPVAQTPISSDDELKNARLQMKEINSYRDTVIDATKAAREDAVRFSKEVIVIEKHIAALFAGVKDKLQAQIDTYKTQKELELAQSDKGKIKAAKTVMDAWEALVSKTIGNVPTIESLEYLLKQLVIPDGLLGNPAETYGPYLQNLVERKQELEEKISKLISQITINSNQPDVQELQTQLIEAQAITLKTLQQQPVPTPVAEKPTPSPLFVGSSKEQLVQFAQHIAKYARDCAPTINDEQLANVLEQVLDSYEILADDVAAITATTGD
jgi:hypothetical protein